MGSTISYLQRYTVLSLTGLATEDQDDDGQEAGVKYIDEKQISQITDLMNEHLKESDHEDFLKWANIQTIETIRAENFNAVVSSIKASNK
jgi:hypothetical protein